mmetsp:Transcript_53234/g.147482  ORF Transcript_53234/g.147482 Transcript_53234/m.147482 type:complete len:364 (+) Transcript_53234:409-1500(+)
MPGALPHEGAGQHEQVALRLPSRDVPRSRQHVRGMRPGALLPGLRAGTGSGPWLHAFGPGRLPKTGRGLRRCAGGPTRRASARCLPMSASRSLPWWPSRRLHRWPGGAWVLRLPRRTGYGWRGVRALRKRRWRVDAGFVVVLSYRLQPLPLHCGQHLQSQQSQCQRTGTLWRSQQFGHDFAGLGPHFAAHDSLAHCTPHICPQFGDLLVRCLRAFWLRVRRQLAHAKVCCECLHSTRGVDDNWHVLRLWPVLLCGTRGGCDKECRGHALVPWVPAPHHQRPGAHDVLQTPGWDQELDKIPGHLVRLRHPPRYARDSGALAGLRVGFPGLLDRARMVGARQVRVQRRECPGCLSAQHKVHIRAV